MRSLGICLLGCLLASVPVFSQHDAPTGQTPDVLRDFSTSVGARPTGETVLKQARERLWQVYPRDERLKKELVDYVRVGADGPQLAFASIALIPFHDPKTVIPVMTRALDPKLSNMTRWYFMNAAPYILGMGDVMYMEDGALDKDTREEANEMIQLAKTAADSSLGHAHAASLKDLLKLENSAEGRDPDYGLAIWHQSAYLVGTLDLKDERLLEPAFDPKHRLVFVNSMEALSFMANHDFLSELKAKEAKNITPAMEHAAASAARDWWDKYLGEHPDGDWLAAAIKGMQDADYHLDGDIKAAQSQRELLRALDSSNPIIRYNAYRLLNRVYATNFDLDCAFFAGKYALSFLDPSGHEQEFEKRMKQYWISRLNVAAQTHTP